MKFSFYRSVSFFLEVAHDGVDGKVHGHSLQIKVFTGASCDLDRLLADAKNRTESLNFSKLEDSVGGRTFEDVAAWILLRMQDSVVADVDAVSVVLPSIGHDVTVMRQIKS